MPRKKNQGIYYENHHIIPKSLGGSDCKDNMVLLTNEEHFLAHRMLMKFTTGDDQRSMASAFLCMERSPSGERLTSRSYEGVKKKLLPFLERTTLIVSL